MNTVMVTGGAGFIGSALVQLRLAAGLESSSYGQYLSDLARRSGA